MLEPVIHQPSINGITSGLAVFSDEMPIWNSTFGSDVWPFIDETSPLYIGKTSSSFVWRDYIHGHGSTFNHKSSFAKKYHYCLTEEMVKDLKVAAVIHGYFPKLLKNSKSTKLQLDPKTVKGRIDELAKFFSLVLDYHLNNYGYAISRFNEISFQLIKECIPIYSGRSSHLKRALKLISDPIVQKNLSSPLQWNLHDLSSKSINWSTPNDLGGIPTLTDAQFLFLMSYCRKTIVTFKHAIGLNLHDTDADKDIHIKENPISRNYLNALNKHYELANSNKKIRSEEFRISFGYSIKEVSDFLIDAQCASIMVILLLTGMRESETTFLMTDCLCNDNGYWFLKSKVVKL